MIASREQTEVVKLLDGLLASLEKEAAAGSRLGLYLCGFGADLLHEAPLALAKGENVDELSLYDSAGDLRNRLQEQWRDRFDAIVDWESVGKDQRLTYHKTKVESVPRRYFDILGHFMVSVRNRWLTEEAYLLLDTIAKSTPPPETPDINRSVELSISYPWGAMAAVMRTLTGVLLIAEIVDEVSFWDRVHYVIGQTPDSERQFWAQWRRDAG